ncbi:hypothetical protein MMAG44476_28479 [Mycolicibacterium mageritense DSM 44476 = CIP 104973]|uniref:PE-PPE domain-containing protein n=1 Tax=Mycolicibacterium mageritense TaxID=53462 RepID=A0AAI8XP06_MYCME|nr:hypothetical protein [Mycolicibacterium mageritense]MBN3457070.1 hypothetical protein [Mycobacterium sp. DSM 3803]MCC9180716.1 hypothetical protein [Mycolicibacterium mageritense]TXI52209.1 MAG: hypothetical protein E6Q55_37355 [Mycolicibacterium mageritense]CDO20986.1 hypothetical protein BN978_01444 [Mycolicibacterium mageritense DSM 44476 = CIP 104973]BBX34495.1 hypothetical protein MMAGJ_37770 [Mycolicibacterium mageritense]
MQIRVQCGLTAGIAIVGASVIAITPIASPAVMRAVDAAPALMRSFAGLSQAELIAMSVQRLGEQVQQAPFFPLVAALDVAGGDNARLYTAIRSVIDSPVYVADPFIEAVANTVPTSLGGGSDHETTTTAGDGAIMQIRNVQLLGLRDSLDGLFADALGVPASTDANYAFDLSNGVAESVERTAQGAVLAPIGLVAVAQAMASGDSAALYTAIRQYIDAPLWAADPAIDGLATALPASLGGGTDHDPTTQAPQDGALMTFRNETLWGATHNTRVAVANVLGVDLDAQDNPEPSTTLSVERTVAADDEATKDSDKPDVTNLKPHFTTLNAQVKQAGDRAEKRANKVKANVNEALTGVREAVENVTKKLTPKKAEPKGDDSAESNGDDS